MTVTDPAVSAAVPRSDLVAVSKSIADEVAAEVAVEVDRLGRFPSETIEACSEAGILGALVPEPLGGMGASITEVGRSVSAIGRHCASSAMVLAMHHLQVACLARHGRTGALRRYLAEVADLQLLLASATTEINIGGQLRTSACSVVPTSTGFSLEKEAPVISYGAYADAILVTARRFPDLGVGGASESLSPMEPVVSTSRLLQAPELRERPGPADPRASGSEARNRTGDPASGPPGD